MRSDFPRSILSEVAHRPWRMPDRPWLMSQTWHDLLFAHWPIEPERLRATVPGVFDLDVFDGAAWIGIVPFYMTNVAPRGVPSLPWLSEFPEMNVRTYVRVGDRPGVYFYSLDAGRSGAVLAARTLLNLPYFRASMAITRTGSAIAYESRRRGANAVFAATYQPTGPVFEPVPGSLEYFLTERYCLYNLDRRGLPYSLEIHHPPWPLQVADAAIRRNSMADAAGVALPATAPLLHFAKRQDMVAWAAQRIS